MPTVEIDPDELRELTGEPDRTDQEFREDLFALGLEYEGETDDGEFELEFGPDRLDRLSVEGVARSLRYQYGSDRGVYVPNTNDAEWAIRVDGDVPDERPYVTGAVVRGLDLDESALASLIQLQEKLHATMGRKRAKGAIGVHDLVALKGAPAGGSEATDEEAADPRVETPTGRATEKSVRYTGIGPREDRFVPLDSDIEMRPVEVLKAHETGSTYADIVEDYERMPAIYDDVGMFSFPPVINGKRTEVSTDSRDLFVEMTGTDQRTIDRMLNIVCYALDARGGRVEEVAVEYEDDAAGEHAGRELVRPDFSTKTKTVAHDDVESMLGIDLDGEAVVDLIERSGLDAEVKGEDGDADLAYEVAVPPYRVDVLHPVDVVDDIGRAFGFNELEPRYPDISTVGGRHERSRLEGAARDALVGFGFEDLLNFHLVGEAENFDRLGVERPERRSGDGANGDDRGPGTGVFGGHEPGVIGEPYSEDYEILRTWALPSVMLVLENNTHRAYPQDLAEVGFSAYRDDDEPTKMAERHTVAAALARSAASYEDARSRLQALCRVFDVTLETPETEHPTFIDGRTAEVVIDGESVGVVGEVHPRVLVEYDLELPVAAFEFELDALR
ncbi:MAG: phenylalanine--tRNA ligase subunit beta [Haloarculaceae archaeon]